MTTPATVPTAEQGVSTRLPFDPDSFLKDLDQRVARLIAKNKGDPEEAIGIVMIENKKYRDQLDALTKQNNELRAALPGKEDQLLKTPEERALFKSVQDLVANKVITKPEDLKALVTQRDELLAKQQDHERDELAKELAGEEFDDVGLKEILELKGMVGEIKTVTVRDPKDPKKTVQEKLPHVRKKDDDKAVAQPLKDWLEANVSRTLLAALRKDTAKEDGTRGDGRRRVASFPDQTSVTTGAKGKAESGSNKEAVGNYLSNTFTLPDHLKKKE